MIFDVDGVLTDGRLFVDNHGQEYKAFNSRDGHGMKMLRDSGVEIGIITGRNSGVVTHRAKELGIRHVHQGSDDKLASYRQLLKETGLSEIQTAFVGDDVVDLPVLLQSGLAVAVQKRPPAGQKTRALGHPQCRRPGRGARTVRDAHARPGQLHRDYRSLSSSMTRRTQRSEVGLP